jgi:zinc protease
MPMFFLLLFLLISPAHAEGLSATGFTLKNGLQVQVVEYHRAPVVTHMLWFRIGASDDPKGVSGVAHYLEHMMFKGTKTVPDGEYTRRIEKLGGEQNAFTGADFTAYYVTIAKEHLAKVMELEADRMQNLAPTGFAKERDVIIEERRMRIDNQPSALLAEKMAAKLFAGHPYGIPIIGWKREMAKLSKKDVMRYYRTHYRPNAAVLVLVGDITPPEAKELAEKYYGDWPTADVPERAWPDYVPLANLARVQLSHAEVHQPIWARDYPASSLVYGRKSHTFPLMLLADLLGGGRSSWLYQRLVVERKLAVEAAASYSPFTLGPSTLGVTLVPAQGVSMEALEAAYTEELHAFLQREIPARDLERVKNNLKAAAIYLRDGIQGQAYILGQLLMLGYDAEFFAHWTKQIDAVQTDDIKKSAALVLQENYALTGLLLPEKKEAKE